MSKMTTNNTEYLTYSKFYNITEAEELIFILEREHIAYKIEKEKDLLDKNLVGETLDPLILLKIQQKDFATVNNLMLNKEDINLNEIHKDYYLFQFTQEELLDVLDHPLEWNYLDRIIAKKILEEKHIPIMANGSQSNTVFYEPLRLQTIWLVFQYLLSVLIPFAGIIISVFTLNAIKTLPTGNKVKMYDTYTRQHAFVILIIGILRTVWWGIANLFFI